FYIAHQAGVDAIRTFGRASSRNSRFGTGASLKWAPLASTGWCHGRSKTRGRGQACCLPAAERDALRLRRRWQATDANLPRRDAGRPRLRDVRMRPRRRVERRARYATARPRRDRIVGGRDRGLRDGGIAGGQGIRRQSASAWPASFAHGGGDPGARCEARPCHAALAPDPLQPRGFTQLYRRAPADRIAGKAFGGHGRGVARGLSRTLVSAQDRYAHSGAEALAPIRHRTLGCLPPEYVMPDDPHVGAVSELVIDRMINDWRYFTAQHGHIEIAVNLPITLFRDPELIEHLYRRIPDHPAFEGLIVQVNAADVVRNLGLVKKVARLLRYRTIAVSIGDLGAEWPSLTGLGDFPFVELKVARQFIAGCAGDRRKRAACRRIIDLADAMGARTVADAVENRADFLAARELGFSLAQGALFAKPMTAKNFAR